MSKRVLAIAAHPDDIEFVMAGTLLQLVSRGWQAYYFCIANGCCGSNQTGQAETAETRLEEAKRAADAIPAVHYRPLRNDLEIFYDNSTHREVTAVVRQCQPSIILTHALSDYMEDHQNTARLAVGAAFARGMKNFESEPAVDPYDSEVAIYHAQPHGNRDPLGNLVVPRVFVDVTQIMSKKTELLGMHESQAAWLDESQKMNSYIQTMVDLNKEVGHLSNKFAFAEGWTQHIHLGLSSENFNPLCDALASDVHSAT